MVRVDQVITGFLQADLLEVFEGGSVQLLFKGTVTFPLAAQTGLSNLIQCDLFNIVLVHVGDHRFDPGGRHLANQIGPVILADLIEQPPEVAQVLDNAELVIFRLGFVQII